MRGGGDDPVIGAGALVVRLRVAARRFADVDALAWADGARVWGSERVSHQRRASLRYWLSVLLRVVDARFYTSIGIIHRRDVSSFGGGIYVRGSAVTKSSADVFGSRDRARGNHCCVGSILVPPRPASHRTAMHIDVEKGRSR